MAEPRTACLARLCPLTILSFLSLIGCQSADVRRQTVSMCSHLSDLQYRQVVDNLALIADNPSALPHFALAQGGHSNVQYISQTNAGLNWDRITSMGGLLGLFLLDKESAMQTSSRQAVSEWDTVPDVDPLQEILMQGLYRRALGLPIPAYQLAALEAFFFAKL